LEHAEHIAEAVSYTKDTFLQIDGIINWIKLFFAIIIPILSGFAIASIILQFIVKPALVTVLITPNLGFTEGAISYILQYIAVLTGLVFVFFFPYYQGYLYCSMKRPDNLQMASLHTLFVSGWKINAVLLYYVLPLIIIFLLYAALFAAVNSAVHIILPSDLAGFETVFDYILVIGYLVAEFITAILVSLFGCIGLVHLARTGSVKQAVNMRNIAGLIKKIGWYDYILSIVIITILLLTTSVLFLGIAGIFNYAAVSNTILFVLMLFVIIPLGVFVTRYLANVYDTAFLETEEDIEEFDDF